MFRVLEIFDFITKDLLGPFLKISSVAMPASLLLQLKKIIPKSLFVLKSFKLKHSLTKIRMTCKNLLTRSRLVEKCKQSKLNMPVLTDDKVN